MASLSLNLSLSFYLSIKATLYLDAGGAWLTHDGIHEIFKGIGNLSLQISYICIDFCVPNQGIGIRAFPRRSNT
jgi:hypothetical protein